MLLFCCVYDYSIVTDVEPISPSGLLLPLLCFNFGDIGHTMHMMIKLPIETLYI